MAGVYRAWDAQLSAWRAIKVLLPEYANRSTLRSRFEREAATMARLSSPHIIRVFDVVHDEALPFMVMELAEGGTLVGWLDAYGRMPASLACEVTEQVASGLLLAHGHGVVHRDIKPHNVLITLDGQCKLTDFGIAQVRRQDGAPDMTRTGSTMGTIGYMAPEQRADAKTVDHRADIYSLGALLFKLITGTIMSDLFLVEHEPELLDDVPEVLHEIVVRACYHDRERRFATAEAFIETLRQVRAFLPTDPRDTPPLVIPVTDTPTEAGERPFPEIAVLLDAQSPSTAPVDSLAPTQNRKPLSRSVAEDVTELRPPAPKAEYTVPVRHPAAEQALFGGFSGGPVASREAHPMAFGFTPSESEPLGPHELGSLPPGPPGPRTGREGPTESEASARSAGTGTHRIVEDRAFEEARAAIRRWSVVLGGVTLVMLLLVMGSTLMVRWAVSKANGARADLYVVIQEEQSILQHLEDAGLEPAALEDLREHFVAFEDAEGEPERLRMATEYVLALQSRARPVWRDSAPNGLVRVRANAIEKAYLQAAKAHSVAVQATRTPPGRLAVATGFVERP